MAEYRNEILRRLHADVVGRLELRAVELPVLREIEFPGKSIDHVFFLEDGVASMTTTFQDGSEVEVALAGFESVLGASSMMGTKRSLNRVYMQVAGCGFSSATRTATREFELRGQFHDLTLRYLQAQFVQTAQTAGCNAQHELPQRFARWLLLCADRMQADVLPLSQEFLAQMLGVRRSSVSVVAAEFQDRGLIQYTRGRLKLTDRRGLEKITCECYAVVRDHLANFAEVDTSVGA